MLDVCKSCCRPEDRKQGAVTWGSLIEHAGRPRSGWWDIWGIRPSAVPGGPCESSWAEHLQMSCQNAVTHPFLLTSTHPLDPWKRTWWWMGWAQLHSGLDRLWCSEWTEGNTNQDLCVGLYSGWSISSHTGYQRCFLASVWKTCARMCKCICTLTSSQYFHLTSICHFVSLDYFFMWKNEWFMCTPLCTRAATNDYCHYQLICWLFLRLIC